MTPVPAQAGAGRQAAGGRAASSAAPALTPAHLQLSLPGGPFALLLLLYMQQLFWRGVHSAVNSESLWTWMERGRHGVRGRAVEGQDGRGWCWLGAAGSSPVLVSAARRHRRTGQVSQPVGL